MRAALNPTVKELLRSLGADRRFVRGRGTHLYDEAGREYLDCWAQYGVLALGHNPPAVVAAVREALAEETPAFLQPYRAAHAEALAERLVATAPAGIAHCLFTSSGAETVEAALKLCRAASGRARIVTAEGSYHGATYAAMAASGQAGHKHGFGPLPDGFDRVPYGDAEALEAHLARVGAETAAFLVEPIQGRRGAHAPPPGYLVRAHAACSRHGVALIADEIQTGLGRTGTLYACQPEAVGPDVLLVAKALGGGLFPLGACLVAERWWSDDFGLRHLSTFANNNLACRAGLAALEQIEALLPALPATAARLAQGLADLTRRHPTLVREVRAHGLLAAIELQPPGPAVSALANALALDEGVLVLPAVGEANVLRFIPPLIISLEEIDRAVSALDRTLSRFEDAL